MNFLLTATSNYTEIILEETQEFKSNPQANKLKISLDIIPKEIIGNSSIQNLLISIETDKNSGVKPFFTPYTDEFEFTLQKFNRNSEFTLEKNIKLIENDLLQINDKSILNLPLIYTDNLYPYFKTFKLLNNSISLSLDEIQNKRNISFQQLYPGIFSFKKNYLRKVFFDNDFFGNFILEKFIIDISQRNSFASIKDGLYLNGFSEKSYFYPDFLQNTDSNIGVIAINTGAFQKKIHESPYFKNNYLYPEYFSFTETNFLKINPNDKFKFDFLLDISKSKSSFKEGAALITCIVTSTEGKKYTKTFKLIYNKGLKGIILDDIKDSIIITKEFEQNCDIQFNMSHDTYTELDEDASPIPLNFTESGTIDISNKSNIINTLESIREIDNKEFKVFLEKTNISKNLSSYLVNLGIVYQYSNNIQNLKFKIRKKENDSTLWSEISSDYFTLDKNTLSNNSYYLAEFEIDIFIENYPNTPEKTIRVLFIALKNEAVLSPVLNQYSPKYFKKTKEKKSNNNLLNLPTNSNNASEDYYYYGLKNKYSPNLIASTATKNNSSIINLDLNYSFSVDPFGNIQDFTQSAAIPSLNNTNLLARFTFEKFTDYENAQVNPYPLKVFLLSDYLEIRNDHIYSNLDDEYDSYLRNDNSNNIILSEYEKKSLVNHYTLTHTLQDLKYKLSSGNKYIANNFKITFPKNEEVFFFGNKKIVPRILKNYNLENEKYLRSFDKISSASEFDLFGCENNLNLSQINEFIPTSPNDNIKRKIFMTNFAILDKNNNYIPFKTSLDYEIASLNINLNFRWNYISKTKDILVENDNLYLEFKAISEYNINFNEANSSDNINLFTKSDFINNFNIFLDDFSENSILEAKYIRNLYSNENFNPETNNSYEITDSVSDHSLLINPDFFSRLGNTLKINSIFRDSEISNNNSLNHFFLVNSSQKLRINIKKDNLLNTENLEFPGFDKSKDNDSRFILSSSNSKLFQYFFVSDSYTLFPNFKEISSEIYLPETSIENLGNKYLFEDENGNHLYQDQVYVDPVLSSSNSAIYFSNTFNSYDNSLTVNEEKAIYSRYRLSKFVSPFYQKAPNILSHIQTIDPDFSTPEELYLDFSLPGINTTKNRIKKIISCDYENILLNNLDIDSLNKYEIKYNIIKVLPNITNIYHVSDNQIKKLSKEHLSSSNVSKSDVSANSMFEWAIHGRIYDNNSIYICNDSSSKYYYKIDHFNLDYLSQSFQKLSAYDSNNIKKYFSNIDFNEPTLKNSLINKNIQTIYENASQKQNLKSFLLNNTKDETKGNYSQVSYNNFKTDNPVLLSMLYSSNSKLLVPFSVFFISKSYLNYEKYTIKNVYSKINSINFNNITHVLTIPGNIYKIDKVNFENTPTIYLENGEKLKEDISLFLNLEVIPDSNLKFEKIRPINFFLNTSNKYFDRSAAGKKREKNMYLHLENTNGLFTSLTENNSLNLDKKNIFSNMVYSYKNFYENDINFSSDYIDISTEAKIENSLNEDYFKIFPKDRYSFFTSGSKFIFELSEIFSQNDFNRSLLENSLHINSTPVDVVHSKNILNPDDLNFEYLHPKFSSKLHESIEASLIFLNQNNYSKDLNKDNFFIKNINPIYIFPKLRTNISLKDKIALKDKFDIAVTVDFRDDVFDVYEDSFKEYSSSSLLNTKVYNDKLYYNGLFYNLHDSFITYKLRTYIFPESVSKQKKRIHNKIIDSSYFDFSTKENLTQNVLYPKIKPIVFLDNIIFSRKKNNSQSFEKIISFNFNDIDDLSDNSCIYFRTEDGSLKTDKEILEEIYNLNLFRDNFDSIEIKRMRFVFDKFQKDYIYSFSIKGIQLNSELFAEYFDVKAKSKLILSDTAKLNKEFVIESDNKKKAKLLIRKYKNF